MFMAPKRLSPLEEPPIAPSSSREEDEPSSTTMPMSPPPSPSYYSDSGSDSEHRWIIKPNKPTSPKVKRAKKNGGHTPCSPGNKNIETEHVNAIAISKSKCRPRKDHKECENTTTDDASKEVDKTCGRLPSLRQSEMSEDVSKRWNDLQLAQLEYYINRVQLMANKAKLMCEAYNSSNH